MTQKTDNFKTTQIPRWQDGELANGANFRQLIEAISKLIDEEIGELSARPVSIPDGVKQSILGELTTTLTNKVNDLKTSVENDVKQPVQAAVERSLREPLKNDITNTLKGFIKQLQPKTYKYSYEGNVFRVYVYNTDGEISGDVLNNEATATKEGLKYLKEVRAVNKLNVDKLNDNLFILNRPDGARLVWDITTHTIKPAASLIG